VAAQVAAIAGKWGKYVQQRRGEIAMSHFDREMSAVGYQSSQIGELIVDVRVVRNLRVEIGDDFLIGMNRVLCVLVGAGARSGLRRTCGRDSCVIITEVGKRDED